MSLEVLSSGCISLSIDSACNKGASKCKLTYTLNVQLLRMNPFYKKNEIKLNFLGNA